MTGDTSNTPPAWQNGVGANATGEFADNAGNEPILNVTYSPAGGTSKFMTLLGVG